MQWSPGKEQGEGAQDQAWQHRQELAPELDPLGWDRGKEAASMGLQCGSPRPLAGLGPPARSPPKLIPPPQVSTAAQQQVKTFNVPAGERGGLHSTGTPTPCHSRAEAQLSATFALDAAHTKLFPRSSRGFSPSAASLQPHSPSPQPQHEALPPLCHQLRSPLGAEGAFPPL